MTADQKHIIAFAAIPFFAFIVGFLIAATLFSSGVRPRSCPTLAQQLEELNLAND